MLNKILIFCCILFIVNAQDCKHLLHELGDQQSKFIYCVTTHSVPVTMCNGCQLQYEDILKTYDILAQSCNATYFDKDRINIVRSAEALLTGLWTKAYCDDCFNNNNSQIFEEKNSDFYGCLNKNPVEPCEECNNVYKDLNDFYLSLDQHNDGEVCFDIQDSMNRTRYKWSKGLQCCLRQYNILYFSIALGITTFITLMFYYGTYLLTKRQERNHGILNDEDPSFNLPSSSAPNVAHLNISNNQIQPSTSTPVNEATNIEASASQILKDKNKATEAVEDTEESSDDEPLIKSSVVKEKLK